MAGQYPRVAVNLSPMQFKHLQLVAIVARALADAKLPAQRLELEITESILLENTAGDAGHSGRAAQRRRADCHG